MWRKIAITAGVVLCLLTSISVGSAVASTAVGAMTAVATESAYPPPPVSITVSRATACEDEMVQLSGTGFTPGETVLLSSSVAEVPQGLRAIAGAPGVPSSVVADASGSFTLSLSMPAGSLTIVAVGANSGMTGTVVVTICSGPTTVPPTTQGPPAGPLPDTGAGFDLTSGLVIGLGAVLIGLALALYGGRDLYRSRRTRRLAH